MAASAVLPGLLLGFVFGIFWMLLTNNIFRYVFHTTKLKIASVHFHHSMLSVFPFAGSIFFTSDIYKFLLLIGLGIGIIIHHGVTGGWVFVTKT